MLGAAAMGAAAAALPKGAHAAAVNPRRIDTHCHVVPPAFITAQHEEKSPDFMRWSVQGLLDQMDNNGIESGVLSLNSPGVDFTDAAAAAKLARDCNEFTAQMVRDRPKRFGLLTALPLLHTDESLKEIAYGYDTLKADGICLVTSYKGKYLGDKQFDPIWEELNRRKAVVFSHPQTPIGDHSERDRILEMPFDTARAVFDLVLASHFKKYPDIRWIFAHGGGGLPFLWQRIQDSESKRSDVVRGGLQATLKDVHFDVVGAANKIDFQLISQLWGMNRLTFGTDWSFVEAKVTADNVDKLNLSAADAYAVNRGNAEKLFPRFKA
jgi:predicted TIM-barrel fold metal-dependent hydrolase